MKKALLTAALFALGALGTGCVHRELVGFDDHSAKPLTSMRVMVSRNYVFWSSREFVFYSCSENGDALTCKRLCGGSNDLVCPEAQGSGYGATTNIR